MSDANIYMLLIEFAGAWACGHAPSFFVRYAWKGAPLRLGSATFIGVASCVLLTLAASAAQETVGIPSLQTTAGVVGISSLFSIRTMVQAGRVHRTLDNRTRLFTWPLIAFLLNLLILPAGDNSPDRNPLDIIVLAVLMGTVWSVAAIVAAAILNSKLAPTQSALPFAGGALVRDAVFCGCVVVSLGLKSSGQYGFASILLGFAAISIVRRGRSRPFFSWGSTKSDTQADLMRRLLEMIADPATNEQQRALAREKLGQLEEIAAKCAGTPQTSVSGCPTPERRQTGGHPQRHMRLRRDHSDEHNPESITRRDWRHRNGRIVAYALAGVLLLDLLLIISGYRVLVGEKVVPAGERYQTAEWVHGSDDGSTIVCWYWTGRSVKEISRWYGQRGLQIDECRFIFAPAEAA